MDEGGDMAEQLQQAASRNTARPSRATAFAIVGLLAWAVAVALNTAGELGPDDGTTSGSELALMAVIAGVGLAAALLAARFGAARGGVVMGRTALVLGLLAAVFFVAFWTGWSSVLGAAAAGLALDQRRVGEGTGLAVAGGVVGAIAAIAATAVTVVG
jgi:hypothetical protein